MNVFEQALLNTLMGMGTVFAVLIFISLLISLFVYIPSIETALKNRSSKKEKNSNNIIGSMFVVRKCLSSECGKY